MVEVIGTGDAPPFMPADRRWIPQGSAGRTLRFVDTRHDHPEAAARVAAAFPGCDIQMFPLSLREIFLILARSSSPAAAARGDS
jgi:hypothetical protein